MTEIEHGYMAMHDAAIAAYEAATPADYRYSAVALRKAVDAAIAFLSAIDATAIERLTVERDEANNDLAKALTHINLLVTLYEDEHPEHSLDGHLNHDAVRAARAFYLGYWDRRADEEQSLGSAFADAIGGGFDHT